MKKLFRVMAPILVLVGGIVIVQVLVAAKPEPEKSEEETRLVSLYVDEVKSEMVTVSVKTQGEVRPKTEVCNGLDDDCDGQTDDNITSKGALCPKQLGTCK